MRGVHIVFITIRIQSTTTATSSSSSSGEFATQNRMKDDRWMGIMKKGRRWRNPIAGWSAFGEDALPVAGGPPGFLPNYNIHASSPWFIFSSSSCRPAMTLQLECELGSWFKFDRIIPSCKFLQLLCWPLVSRVSRLIFLGIKLAGGTMSFNVLCF